MSALTTTLPASWFQSHPLYQIERRAIFLKSWHLLGPVTRFQERNVKVPYEIAQVKFYAINTSEESAGVGKEGIAIYDENDRPLRTHFTSSGLVFVTLSEETADFDQFFPGLEDLLTRVDFTKLPHRRSLSYEGHFNWKTMMDGYQECLHCQYTHPSFSKFYPPTFYAVENHTNFCRHIADPKKPDDGLFLYFFPVCTLNVYGGGMTSFRTCPTSDPCVSRMEFDYYNLADGEAFEQYFQFVRQVALEDFELCEKAQSNLEKGIYGEGILNPVKENGVAYYQQRVRDLVFEQHALDEKAREDTACMGVDKAALPSGIGSAPLQTGIQA